MKRTQLRSLIHFIFKALSHLDVQGRENIPAQGGCILASNHQGIVDAPLVFVLLERQDSTSLVADNYKTKPFLGWLISQADPIWINREEADLDALRQARSFLQSGGLLGIAPEGTRSRTGGLIHAKTGVAYLADKAGVPIVPVGISGTQNGVRRMFTFQRPVFHVQIAPPFHLPPIDRHSRAESLQANTDEIMCRIAAMLPHEQRGVYANHPRLAEILASQD
jgi:1-acyl-sn-glycerol-3-phosphate acyltransferase